MPATVKQPIQASQRDSLADVRPATEPKASLRKLLVDRRSFAAFFGKITLSENGCWLWWAATSDGGYGVYEGHAAHRVSYRWFVGPIPDGYQVDHLCRHKRCVNPAHLEAVTRSENNLRASSFQLNGTCRKGHLLTPSDIGMMRNGTKGTVRVCLICRRESRARRAS